MNQLMPTTGTLVDVLRKHGFDLPKECISAEIFMPPNVNQNGFYQIRYTCHLTYEDLQAIGAAFAEVGRSGPE